MDKFDEEIIKYLTHHKNSLWATIVVLAGGLVGLLLSYNPNLTFVCYINVIRSFFFVLGVIFFIGMFIGLLNTDSDIRKILKKGSKS